MPPQIYLGGLLPELALDRAFPRPFLPKASCAVGLPLLVGGVSLAGWFGRTMRRAGTPFRLDEPATTLVTDGPFRHGRNPDYLSFAMVQAGQALLANSFWAVVLVPATTAVIRVRVIEREKYLRYEAGVRRWV